MSDQQRDELFDRVNQAQVAQRDLEASASPDAADRLTLPQHGDSRTCPDCPGGSHHQRYIEGYGWAHANNFDWLSKKYAAARRSVL